MEAPSGFRMVSHTIPCAYIREYPRAVASAQDDELLLCINQYIPVSNPCPSPGDVTLLATHGCGLPKELYEPLFEDLLVQCEARGTKIRGIWIADMCHQGASGVANEDKLGNDPSWFDHCRDLLALVNHFRADMPRPIIGLGHSMGAAQLILLSLMHPRLMTSMVLLEPVMERCTRTIQAPALTKLSTFRRDVWASREEAEVAARKSYKKWNGRVLQRWMRYGLREGPTALYPDARGKGVTLTTTKHQEVFSYLRPNFGGEMGDLHKTAGEKDEQSMQTLVDRLFYPDVVGPAGTITPFYRPEPIIAFKSLPYVRASVLYVFADQSPMSTQEMVGDKMATTGVGPGGSGGAVEGRVKQVLLKGAGHLVPMEAPGQCAAAAAAWCTSEVKRWKADEARIAHGWAEKSLQEKSTVSKEWRDKVRAML